MNGVCSSCCWISGVDTDVASLAISEEHVSKGVSAYDWIQMLLLLNLLRNLKISSIYNDKSVNLCYTTL